MKYIFLILILFPFCAAHSEDTNKNSTKGNSNCLYKGAEFYLSYFFGGPMTFSINGADINITNLTFNKYYVPDIGMRYDYIRNDGFGLFADGKYMIERSLTHFSSSSGGSGVGGDASISFALLAANISYYLGDAYWYFGPNYSVPFLKGAGDTSATGGVGGQIGLGWNWGNNISNIDFGTGRLSFELYVQDISFQLKDFLATSGTSTVNWLGGGFKIGVNY